VEPTVTSRELFTFDLGLLFRYTLIGIASLVVLLIVAAIYKAHRRRILSQEREMAMRVREALAKQLKPDIPAAGQGS
jgi:cell division protein FtsL